MSGPTIDNMSSGTNQDGDGRFAAVETYTSRQANLQEGREQRSREFIVYSTGSSLEPLPDAATVVQLTNVEYGDQHPENTNLRAVDVDIRPTRNAGRGAYLVVWNYRAVSFTGGIPGQPNPTPENPEAPDYQEFNLATDPTLIDVWRVPPFDPLAFFEDGNIVFDNDQPEDIGGIPVDTGGIPASYLFRRGTFEITRNIEFSQFDSRPLLEAGGARNQSSFLGFPAGRLLYLGARSTRVSQGVIRITHEIGYDEFAHMQQKPDVVDATGEIKLSQPFIEDDPPGPSDPPATEIFTLDENGVRKGRKYETRHAYKVKWFQPYPRLLEFDSLGIVGPGFFP